MRTFTRRDTLVALAAAATINAIALQYSTPATAQTARRPMTTASGLQIIDTQAGTGASPKSGQTCVMHYTGWLYENGAKGKKFDSSVDRNEPFEFPIGQRKVIAGWGEGGATPPREGGRVRGLRFRKIQLHADPVRIIEEELGVAGARHDALAEFDALFLQALAHAIGVGGRKRD